LTAIFYTKRKGLAIMISFLFTRDLKRREISARAVTTKKSEKSC
jgi:hypothetical protein